MSMPMRWLRSARPRERRAAAAILGMLGAAVLVTAPAWSASGLDSVRPASDDLTPDLARQERLAHDPLRGESHSLRHAYIDFLISDAGLVTVAIAAAIIGLATAYAAFRALEPTGPSSTMPRSAARSRRRGGHRPRENLRSPAAVKRMIAAVLACCCFVLPLIFSIALEDVFALPKTIALRLLAAIVGVLLAVAFLRGARPQRLGPTDIGLAAFLLLSAGATIVSVDPGLSLGGERLQHQGLLSILSYGVLFIGARFALDEEGPVRVVAMALIAGAVLAALYAIIQWIDLDPIWTELYKGRVFSTMGQANALASLLAMSLATAFVLIPGLSRGGRAALFISAALAVGAFLLTFSRGGYLGLGSGLAVACIVFALGRSWPIPRSRLPSIGRSLVVGATLLMISAIVWRPAGQLLGTVAGRAASIANPAESSNKSHLDLWAVGVAIAAEHPGLGTGPDTYVIVFPEYRDRILEPGRAAIMARFRPESPHQVYLATAAGQGVPALIAYLVIIGGCFVKAFRAARAALPRATRLAIAGLAGAAGVHLVTDAFMTAEPATTAAFWVLLGALAGVSDRAHDMRDAPKGK